MRTFEFTDAKSQKFWNIEVTGTYYTVKFGKIGSGGQTQRKTFATAAAAQAEMDKLVNEKLKKGYVETTPKAVATEEAAFHKALTDNPDDVAGWSAFADWLVEQGDPRGEFMQTQLALEDESRPRKDRDALKRKEKALLKQHEREWLGGLAPFVLNEERADRSWDYRSTQTEPVWRRGVLWGLVVDRLSMSLAQVIALDPATRFVQELTVHDTMRGYYGEDAANQPKPRVKTPKGAQRHDELFELIGAPLLANLRRFQMGGEVPPEDGWCDCHTYVPGIEHVIAGMSRIEVLDLYCKEYHSRNVFALPNLTHLRELRVYHLGGRSWRDYDVPYRLDVLAKSPAFANLTHLLFHPHFSEEDDDDDFPISYIPLEQVKALVNSPHLKKLTHLQLRLSDAGDKGVREIIASGILKRLKWLDLRHGCISDEGARLLATYPDAKNLDQLDLSRNAVTAKGLSALRKAGVKAVARKPLTTDELEEREYLHEGDSE
jgi:uncharacterized protein (TIGR02996 family)